MGLNWQVNAFHHVLMHGVSEESFFLYFFWGGGVGVGLGEEELCYELKLISQTLME